MKTVPIDAPGLTLETLLDEAAREGIVFLTSEGETRFVLVPADDGDREVLALRANAEFMDFLADAGEQARTRPRKTLRELRAEFDPE